MLAESDRCFVVTCLLKILNYLIQINIVEWLRSVDLLITATNIRTYFTAEFVGNFSFQIGEKDLLTNAEALSDRVKRRVDECLLSNGSD